MFNHAFVREDIADAHVIYYRHRGSEETRPSKAITDLSQFSAYQPMKHGRREMKNREEYADLTTLQETSLEALACYCALVAKRDGANEAAEMLDRWTRINAKDSVTIVVANSDDDPTQINIHVQDEIADAWADAHGSLDGGTWECADGSDFVYDMLYWRPGLFTELLAEGFKFDFSGFGEPDERDLAVAAHASECDECEYDWHKADEHYDQIYPTWEVRDKETGAILLTGAQEETRLFAINSDNGGWSRKEWVQIAPHAIERVIDF
jgi:hypothetical protein